MTASWWLRSLLGLLLACSGLTAAAGCTTTGQDESGPPLPVATPTSSALATTPGPTSSATAASPAGEPPHPVSLQALMEMDYDGRGLRAGRVLARTSAYTRRFVTYKSGKLTISGIMNVPVGSGPFPVLVLSHGYIDPEIYVNGQGLSREQDYLARRGYVVVHVDYRNHAQSDDDPANNLKLRLGYTVDVVNAVLAVKRSSLPYLARDRVGLLGRSMGGGVTFNALVVKPDLVDAAVVFAPVSSDAVDNFNRWTRGASEGSERRQLASRIIAEYGAPEGNPKFWRNLSAITFFDRVREPLLIHHGTADESCPIEWSRRTLAALERQGKDARLLTYDGEQHAFGPAWPTSMRRTVTFFDTHLGA
jgi:uncharacterized protein